MAETGDTNYMFETEDQQNYRRVKCILRNRERDWSGDGEAVLKWLCFGGQAHWRKYDDSTQIGLVWSQVPQGQVDQYNRDEPEYITITHVSGPWKDVSELWMQQTAEPSKADRAATHEWYFSPVAGHTVLSIGNSVALQGDEKIVLQIAPMWADHSDRQTIKPGVEPLELTLHFTDLDRERITPVRDWYQPNPHDRLAR